MVIVVAVTTLISLRKEIKAGLFTSGAVAAYVAYQSLSALQSLPSDAKCAAKTSTGFGPFGNREASEIVALVLALAALAASVARAGTSHDAFGLPTMVPGTAERAEIRGKENSSDENKVTARRAAKKRVPVAPSPEGFGLRDVSLSDDEEETVVEDSKESTTINPAAATYFHLVFSSASMYARWRSSGCNAF